jgi:carboxymethylenebutenolidase
MQTSTVEITTPDGVADAYLARPDDRPLPGVLFVMDLFGLRPAIDEMANRIASDGGAYLDYLADAASPGPVAVTGYCICGRVGWRIAAAHPDRVAALAAFHAGRLVTDDPDSPHRSADELRAELYFGFADQDPSMTAEQIAALERTLQEAGARYRSEIYEGARHGYTMADLAVYDEAAGERHYRELRALLERALGGEG